MIFYGEYTYVQSNRSSQNKRNLVRRNSCNYTYLKWNYLRLFLYTVYHIESFLSLHGTVRILLIAACIFKIGTRFSAKNITSFFFNLLIRRFNRVFLPGRSIRSRTTRCYRSNDSVHIGDGVYFFTDQRITIFWCAIGPGKHSENDTVLKEKKKSNRKDTKRNQIVKSKEIKEETRERVRESKNIYTKKRELQAEPGGRDCASNRNFAALSRIRDSGEEPVRIFWTFQANAGETRYRSCTRNRVRKANPRRRRKCPPPPRSDLFDTVRTWPVSSVFA